MNNGFYNIKRIIRDLENSQTHDLQIKLLEELADSAINYRDYLINKKKSNTFEENSKNLNIRTKKFSQEVFLYKSVMVKNYYEGDYLERFAIIRTSDLKTSGVFNLHNKFWKAHEVIGGNIFASIPLGLINSQQRSILENLNWNPVNVDIYELIIDSNVKYGKADIINYISKIFDNYLLVKEVYGNIYMVLHYIV
ncbi:MAG: hypothetical protein GX214_05790 [Clostridiales bacterium]|nr:hypothetical protein [Clostridiales bacterium]